MKYEQEVQVICVGAFLTRDADKPQLALELQQVGGKELTSTVCQEISEADFEGWLSEGLDFVERDP